MNKKVFFLFILFCLLNKIQAQITDFKTKFELPSEVSESSGLLFLNGKIVTHNDSGDAAKLYELDSLTGNLLRTINISNATNIDWEDITEDENYIYIGDFGNNNGNRTDLKIIRIAKADYLNSDSVTADFITFSYENQTDFSIRTNQHNFDAEGFVVINNSLFIFTKNWVDFRTNLYKIPKTIGDYTAEKISTANVEGLITGATVNSRAYLLCGYNSTAVPFIIYIERSTIFADNIFNAGFNKTSLNSNELEQFSQVEAITSFDNGKFYISREKVTRNGINLLQKLYEFKDDRLKTLNTDEHKLKDLEISPNPTSGVINITNSEGINNLSIYNALGKKVIQKTNVNSQINISHFPKGIYLLRVCFKDSSTIVKRLIKL
ncbi:T9SS type A sorting domain-containing protein [Polaribacter sp.]|uniref:T9SS type A sorting domain-containing protein n=1 Tax=Polaribacter sp. TaxID=1920175 RepID=UPI0025E8A366|nr:T9SS type A sorting domain-containing protein [Polaribacter sp.]